ncbi:MAG: amidohydrolase family protein [Chloroflexi bacterium]|nr:amidohydrolase family protein [Chloroflexota bacterium]
MTRRVFLPADVRIVDSHVHAWPHGLVHPAQRVQEPMAASPADLLATLDASGVDAVLVSPAMVHPDNGYIQGAAGAVPTRILAVAGVDPRDPSAVAGIPDHAAAGVVAVRVNLGPSPLETEADLAGLDALVDATAAAGLVLQWTMRLPGAALIERAAARRPDVPQVFDHLGLPVDARDLGQLARIRDLAGIPTLHIKLSGMYALSQDGYPYRDTWPWAEGVLEAFGASRTMWASDWPLAGESASHAEHLALVGMLPFLDDAARDHLLRRTALSLWGEPRAGGS